VINTIRFALALSDQALRRSLLVQAFNQRSVPSSISAHFCSPLADDV
jgi:hypothetical protein